MRVARNIRALIVKRDHHAQHFQRRIGPRPDSFVGLQQVVGALDGKVSRLDGHDEVRRRYHRIHRQNPQRGRRIDDHVIVIFERGRERILQLEGSVELARQLLFEFGQRQPGRGHEKHGIFCGPHHRRQFHAVIAQYIEHGTLYVRRIKEGDRGVGLGI